MAASLYSVLVLPPEQFPQAYPLIQVSKIDLTLDQWLHYANSLHEQPEVEGGILSVQTGNRYIHALAAYQLRSDCAELRVIQVEHLCVLDLLSRSAGPMLVKALEQRAQAESCSEVQVRAPEGVGVLDWQRHQRPGAMLQALGYTTHDDFLSKRLL